MGTYAVTPSSAVGSGLGNYLITYHPGALTVLPRPLTVTATSRSKPFGTTLSLGSTAFSTAAGQLVNGNTVAGVTLTSAGGAAGAAVGAYPIVPSGATGTGLANYTISYVNGTLTVAIPNRYVTKVNTTLTVAAPGVLATTPGTATAISVTTKPKGTLNLMPSGAFTYAPKSGFTGTDSSPIGRRSEGCSSRPSRSPSTSSAAAERVAPIVTFPASTSVALSSRAGTLAGPTSAEQI